MDEKVYQIGIKSHSIQYITYNSLVEYLHMYYMWKITIYCSAIGSLNMLKSGKTEHVRACSQDYVHDSKMYSSVHTSVCCPIIK